MRAKFAELKYAGGAAACHAEAKEPWLTAEQIPVKDNYTAADLEGMEHLNYAAGLAPFLRGPYSTMYSSTLPPAAGIATIPEGVIVISGVRVCTGVLVSSLSHATHTRLTRLKSANNFLIFIYLFYLSVFEFIRGW